MKFFEYDLRVFLALCAVADESKHHSDITLVKVANKLGTSKQALSQTYFKNINEIIRALHIFVNQEVKEKIQTFISSNNNKHDLIHFFAINILPLLYAKRDYLQALYGGVVDPSWPNYIENQYSEILLPYFSKSEELLGLTPEFVAKYVIGQVMAIINSWLCSPSPKNPIVFSKHFLFLFKHSTYDLLSGTPLEMD